MSNMDTANDFLTRALNAVNARDFELAEAYTKMAQVAVLSAMSSKLGAISDKVDRLASVTNAGKTWH